MPPEAEPRGTSKHNKYCGKEQFCGSDIIMHLQVQTKKTAEIPASSPTNNVSKDIPAANTCDLDTAQPAANDASQVILLSLSGVDAL